MRGELGLLGAVVALLTLAPAADAATIGLTGGVISYAGSGVYDRIEIHWDGSRYRFVPANDIGNQAVLTPGPGCMSAGAGVVSCPGAPIDVDTAGSDDQVYVSDAPTPPHQIVLRMGPGADNVYAGSERDVIDAGSDEDLIDPGLGADDIRGGDGDDAVTYFWREAPVAVGFDDQPNDGQQGEGDNVHSDVEGALGGLANDTLIGNSAGNRLEGGPGNDRLFGGATADRLRGGDGDDDIDAGDSEPDAVECGAGNDHATIDGADNPVRDCERTTNVDADADFSRVGADCNDSNPAIHPGAFDVVENGVDEDCSGADAVNLDRDGDRYPRPVDCNDADARIHPGAVDVPGNRVDEDCRAGPAPYPALDSAVGYASLYFRRYSTFTDLFVRKARAGSTVRLTCAGRGCPFKAKTRKVRRSVRKLSLLTLVRGARLRPRARLEIRITKPGNVGVVTRLTVRGGRQMARSDLCLPPRARKPARCAL